MASSPRADAAPKSPPHRQAARRALAGLVGLESAALVAVAGFYVVGLSRRIAADPTGAWFAVVLSAFAAAGLLVAARGLAAGRRWARSPTLVVQLLIVLVSVGPSGVVASGLWFVGLPLIVLALVVIALLFLVRDVDGRGRAHSTG